MTSVVGHGMAATQQEPSTPKPEMYQLNFDGGEVPLSRLSASKGSSTRKKSSRVGKPSRSIRTPKSDHPDNGVQAPQESGSQYEILILSIDDVIVDDEIYPRLRLSERRVRELLALVDDDQSSVDRAKVVDRPKVVRDGHRYLVCDGAHRTEAHRRLGLAEIEVEVLPPMEGHTPQKQALLYGIEANSKGPLPLTAADRKRDCDLLHRNFPGMTIAEIARQAGMSWRGVNDRIKREERKAGKEPSHSTEETERAAMASEKVEEDGRSVASAKPGFGSAMARTLVVFESRMENPQSFPGALASLLDDAVGHNATARAKWADLLADTAMALRHLGDDVDSPGNTVAPRRRPRRAAGRSVDQDRETP